MSKPAWAGTARTGPLYKHKDLTWFACEGLIALYDARGDDEDYTVLTPDEFLLRATALDQFGKKVTRVDLSAADRQYGREMRKAAADMDEAVKEAKNMGDPSDPTVQDFWRRHRRTGVFSMSKATNDFEVGRARPLKDIAAEGRGTKTTGKADLDEAGLRTVSENQMKLRRLPKKKPRKGRFVLDL